MAFRFEEKGFKMFGNSIGKLSFFLFLNLQFVIIVCFRKTS